MNHSYRLVWNDATQRYVPAPETARGRGKSRAAKALAPAAVLLGALLATAAGAQVLPTGGQVMSGQANIGTPQSLSGGGSQMTIGLASQKAILHWQGFDIGSGNRVQFNQPNASAVALNRVVAGSASQIDGTLTANGQVWLVNPNGVVFGQGSQVNVGGLVASTLDITNADFDAGRQLFTRGAAQGGITNQGNITVADGGTLALLAPTVKNEGTLGARLGNVVLAGGDRITLQAGVDGRLQVAVDPATVRTLIENKGMVVADGGQVVMTSKAADALSASVVSNSGTVQAHTLENKEGRILLLADMQHGKVVHSGLLNASAPKGGHGGFVETSASRVQIEAGAQVTTKAAQGQSGNWLIDPVDLTIYAGTGGGTGVTSGIGADTLMSNLENGSIVLQTAPGGDGNGDIHVNASVTWNKNTLTLNAHGSINVNAAMTAGGTAALAMNYGGYFENPSLPVAVGSGVNMKLNPASQDFLGRVNFNNVLDQSVLSNRRLTINGASYTLLTEAGSAGSTTGLDLQGMNGDRAGKYALAGNIDAGDIQNFAPVGSAGQAFTGTFEGLGHSISNLKVDRGSENNAGLFGVTSNATLRNVGLVDANVKGDDSVGALVGLSQTSNDGLAQSLISNVYVTNALVAGTNNVGGLVGVHTNGNDLGESLISNAYITGTVNGSGHVGGLVGANIATYRANITGAISSAVVTGADNVGGLVGFNHATVGAEAGISSSRVSGKVQGTGRRIGGLVGFNQAGAGSTASILDAHATGEVSGLQEIGGLVGRNHANSGMAIIESSSATGTVSGENFVGGLVGVNIATGDGTAAGYGTAQISESHATGRVSGGKKDAAGEIVADTGGYIGGLVGENGSYEGSVAFIGDSHAEGEVTGAYYVGGLAGSNNAVRRDSLSAIGGSYATGNVRGIGSVGGLVGLNNAADSSDARIAAYAQENAPTLISYATGQVWGSYDVGGLVGMNHATGAGTARISYANAAGPLIVKGTGDNVGGLVGTNHAESGGTASIVGSYSTKAVEGVDHVGGLVGQNTATGVFSEALISASLDDDGEVLAFSYASGQVSGGNYVGGLVGTNRVTNTGEARISDVLVFGTVTGVDNVGGLAGANIATGDKASITGAASSAAVTGANNVGGLVGLNRALTFGEASISSSQAYGKVEGTGNQTGGLVGYNQADIGGAVHIHEATASGSVTGGSFVGGLVGSNTAVSFGMATIESSSATGAVAGENAVGGLVGVNDAKTTGSLTVQGDGTVAGYGTAQIIGSRATGAVSGGRKTGEQIEAGTGSYVGGLVGENTSSGGSAAFIVTSHATGRVTGADSVGGLVGMNHATDGPVVTIEGEPSRFNSLSAIAGSYAQGSVEGAENVGGLVGQNTATAHGIARIAGYSQAGETLNSRATGTVSGRNHVGGLVGKNIATDSGTARISFANATGLRVEGIEHNVGGLVGANEAQSSGTAEIVESQASAVVTGADNVGGLVGSNAAFMGTASIENSSASGQVSGASYVGGLVGANTGLFLGTASISGSHATGNVSGVRGEDGAIVPGTGDHLGGLVGENLANLGTASISGSQATGQVLGGSHVGGLVGTNSATLYGEASISEAYAGGSLVRGTGSEVGGLVGWNSASDGATASISNARATGLTLVGLANNVGGLVGLNEAIGGTASIAGSHASAESVTGRNNVGGLVGANAAYDFGKVEISESSATGSVTAIDANAGGLAGVNLAQDADAIITRSHASGKVKGASKVGGLVGTNGAVGGGAAEISDAHATGPVDGRNMVGGLVGRNLAEGEGAVSRISDSHASVEIESAVASRAGGLVGSNEAKDGGKASIANSHAMGQVTGQDHVGGLVGENIASAEGEAFVSSSYASVGVSGRGTRAGGLVASNIADGGHADISDSYATGQVRGGYYAGGLVGINNSSAGQASISGSYATGPVSATYDYVGGLVAQNRASGGEASISDSYTTVTATVAGRNVVGGLVGTNFAIGSGTAARISLSTAAGEVRGVNDVGGLVGTNTARAGGIAAISDTKAIGWRVVGEGNNAGGLLGWNVAYSGGTASISRSGASGEVLGGKKEGGLFLLDTGNYIGGLVGVNEGNGGGARIVDVIATGSVSGSTHVGGLVGGNRAKGNSTASISDAHASGVVSGITDVGGLVGYNLAADGGGLARISGSDATGAVSGNLFVGGLVGYDEATGGGMASISGSHASGSVSGQSFVGGLVGVNEATSNGAASISDAFATGLLVQGTKSSVGGLVGYNVGGGGKASIVDSYASGQMSGGKYVEMQVAGTSHVGGLVGANLSGDSGEASIWGTFATGYVTATGSKDGITDVGGLVGWNYAASSGEARISDSYARGSVSGLIHSGGLVGMNEAAGGKASISNAYATGQVTGSSEIGGLVGSSSGSIERSFYATTDAQGNVINSGLAFNGAGQGKAFSELMQLSTFAGWDIDDQGGTGRTWRIYEGLTTPLLRDFLQQVTVNANGSEVAGKTYDGKIASDTVGFARDKPDATLSGELVYASSSKNAGSYSVADGTLRFSGLYSHQLGYDITYGSEMNGLSLTIDRAQLTLGAVTDSKIYDGSTASGAAVQVTGLIEGDRITALGQSFDSRNAGARSLRVDTGYAVDDGNGGNNYAVTTIAAAGRIDARALTLEAVTDRKVYDGSTASTGAVQVAGLVEGDRITALGQSFDSRNAGTRSLQVDTGYAVDDGNGGNNYAVTTIAAAGRIDARALTLEAVTDRKVYDGSTASTGAVQVAGLVEGDRITALGQSFDSRNAGARSLRVDTGYAVDDGNGGNNYAVTTVAATGRIDPRALTVTADGGAKLEGQFLVFDGTEFSTDAGLVPGENMRRVALASAGGATSAASGSYAIVASNARGDSGFEAGNYAIRYVDGRMEVIPQPAGEIASEIASDSAGDVAGATLCRIQRENRAVLPCAVQQRASTLGVLPVLTMTADFIRRP